MILTLIPVVLILLSAGMLMWACHMFGQQSESRDPDLASLMIGCARAKTPKERKRVWKALQRRCQKDLEAADAAPDARALTWLLNNLSINTACLHLLEGDAQDLKRCAPALKKLAVVYIEIVCDSYPADLIERDLDRLEAECLNYDVRAIFRALDGQFSLRTRGILEGGYI